MYYSFSLAPSLDFHVVLSAPTNVLNSWGRQHSKLYMHTQSGRCLSPTVIWDIEMWQNTAARAHRQSNDPFLLPAHTPRISIRITHKSPVKIMTHYRSPRIHVDSCCCAGTLPPYRWHILNLETRLSTLMSHSAKRCVSAVTESQLFIVSVQRLTRADETKQRYSELIDVLFGVGFRICACPRWQKRQKKTKWCNEKTGCQ